MERTFILQPYISIYTLIFSSLLLTTAVALPLSTSSRWIVDETGQRVKLTCVNWVAHLEVVVAEGLSMQPVDVISKKIKHMGFNCVRLTWPLYLATNETLAALTVRQSFMNHGLYHSIAGLQANNPSIVDLSLISAFQAVVENLADNKLMVILDNHISEPKWCCSNYDDNGFFGDLCFDPNLWVDGLAYMATLFKANPSVVGMSLRNELRGPKQNAIDWYRYMQRGAEAVHEANPNVLVLLSGLNFDLDFSFLCEQPVSLTFSNKLVFEMHWYGFSDGQAWIEGNTNEVCGKVANRVMTKLAFLLHRGFPLFVSEFGLDLRGTNENDNRFFNCFLTWAAEHDVDWAYWTVVGSYYLREGIIGHTDVYGLLNWNWSELRNSSFLKRLSVIQSPLRGPGLSEDDTHMIILHPATGLCIIRNLITGLLKLDNCLNSDQWIYTSQKTIAIKGTSYCLQAQGLNRPVRTNIGCPTKGTTWQSISDSKLHLSTQLNHNTSLCLDIDSSHNIISTKCRCVSGNKHCDPTRQWFKIVAYGTTATRTTNQNLSTIAQSSITCNPWISTANSLSELDLVDVV